MGTLNHLVISSYALVLALVSGIAEGQETQIRLVGGLKTSDISYGRLEVFHNGTWGTVCNDNFDHNAAHVVCRSFRYRTGKPISVGGGSGRIWLDEVNCTGSEHAISHCDHKPWGKNDCTYHEDTGVLCYNGVSVNRPFTTGGSRTVRAVQSDYCEPFYLMVIAQWTEGIAGSQETQIRLIDGLKTADVYYGKLELLQYGIWGIVSADGFDGKAARVMCRSLGYRDGTQFCNRTIGEGTGVWWMDGLECSGSEAVLSDCIPSILRSTSDDAWVICYNDVPINPQPTTGQTGIAEGQETQIRLVGGLKTSDISYGRLEVFHNGTWGAVCDDNFDHNAAHVVCRSFRYRTGKPMCVDIGTGPIWLDEVQCTGSEHHISDCDHRPWGEHDCKHYEDIGVFCYNDVSVNRRCTTGGNRTDVSTTTDPITVLVTTNTQTDTLEPTPTGTIQTTDVLTPSVSTGILTEEDSAKTSSYLWLSVSFGVVSLILTTTVVILLILVKKYRPIYKAEMKKGTETYQMSWCSEEKLVVNEDRRP